jgi:hypothetical protein
MVKIIAAFEDPPVIAKILAHLNCLPANRRDLQRRHSTYSKRPNSQSKPVQPLR